MYRRAIRPSFLAAALLLSTTACDKGGDAKADAKADDASKADDAKTVVAAEPDPEVAVEPVAATATAGAPGDEVDDETDGEAETDEAVAAAGEPPPDDDAADDKPAAVTKTTKTTKTTTPTKVEPAKPAEPIAKVDAKPLYEQKCKSCHGTDGKGDTTIGKKVDIPSLVKTKLAKAKIVSTIEKGVPDTKMKGYKGKLTDDEIDAIAGYVLKL